MGLREVVFNFRVGFPILSKLWHFIFKNPFIFHPRGDVYLTMVQSCTDVQYYSFVHYCTWLLFYTTTTGLCGGLT